LAVLVDFYVILCEEGDAVVVAELADGNERTRFEVVENVAEFSWVGECRR
jgi:ribosomal protein S17